MAKKYKDFIILSLIYLATRLTFFTRYPIFNDESTYLRYAIVMTTVSWERWYSMAHTGKQPLLFWIYGLFMRVISNPLVAGRLVSVFIGIFTLLAIYKIGKLIGSQLTARLASLFYIFIPLFVFFDRLVLVDNALAAIFAWILYVFIKAYPSFSARHSIYLGALVGLSFWIKSTALLFAMVVFILYFFVWLKSGRKFLLLQSLLLFVVTIWIIVAPLLLIPQAAMMITMAGEYSYAPMQLFSLRFANVPGNLLHTLFVYLGYVSPILFIGAIITSFLVHKAKVQILLLGWLSAVTVLVIFGIQIHSRYLVFSVVPLLLLGVLTLERFKKITVITLALMAVYSTILVVNPPLFFASFPSVGIFANEQAQYVTGWSSGYGVQEAFNAIDANRKNAKATIAVRWDTGNPEDAMYVFGYRKKYLDVHYMDKRLNEESMRVIESSRIQNVYFVTRKGVYDVFRPLLVPFASFTKPGSTESVEVFRVVL